MRRFPIAVSALSKERLFMGEKVLLKVLNKDITIITGALLVALRLLIFKIWYVFYFLIQNIIPRTEIWPLSGALWCDILCRLDGTVRISTRAIIVSPVVEWVAPASMPKASSSEAQDSQLHQT